MKLKKTVGSFLEDGDETDCSGGQCPSVYENENGEIFIQGYVVENSIAQQVAVPKGENLIKINDNLLRNIIKYYSKL